MIFVRARYCTFFETQTKVSMRPRAPETSPAHTYYCYESFVSPRGTSVRIAGDSEQPIGSAIRRVDIARNTTKTCRSGSPRRIAPAPSRRPSVYGCEQAAMVGHQGVVSGNRACSQRCRAVSNSVRRSVPRMIIVGAGHYEQPRRNRDARREGDRPGSGRSYGRTASLLARYASAAGTDAPRSVFFR